MSARSALSVKSADPMTSEPADAAPAAVVALEPPVLVAVVAEELWLLLPHAATTVIRPTGNATAARTDRMFRFMFLLVVAEDRSPERRPGPAAGPWCRVWVRRSR